LATWLTSEHWKRWKFEPAPRPSRGRSPHGDARVCVNDLLLNAAPTGDLPVGSAAVKEAYEGDKIDVHTVAIRGKPGAGGDKWFWFRKEVVGGAITRASFGDGFCMGCHKNASKDNGQDFIFTLLR
jgi:hypothetical protein